MVNRLDSQATPYADIVDHGVAKTPLSLTDSKVSALRQQLSGKITLGLTPQPQSPPTPAEQLSPEKQVTPEQTKPGKLQHLTKSRTSGTLVRRPPTRKPRSEAYNYCVII